MTWYSAKAQYNLCFHCRIKNIYNKLTFLITAFQLVRLNWLFEYPKIVFNDYSSDGWIT